MTDWVMVNYVHESRHCHRKIGSRDTSQVDYFLSGLAGSLSSLSSQSSYQGGEIAWLELVAKSKGFCNLPTKKSQLNAAKEQLGAVRLVLHLLA